MRVFAGPNGSGKSTIIEGIRQKKVDFGVYVNADDIAKKLLKGNFKITPYKIKEFDPGLFIKTALESGLINSDFPEKTFKNSFKIEGKAILLLSPGNYDRIAQIIADFLRKRLLEERIKFSFETVFSHPGKLDVIRAAVEAGYKVYFYFISTASPEINKYRVLARVKKGGHKVSPDKIEKRYYASMNQLYDAAQLSYQAYFFDNSCDAEDFTMFAHFKLINGEKQWDAINEEDVPYWFHQYYSSKVQNKKNKR